MRLTRHQDPPGWDRQTMPAKGKPHAWIQWKGTKACMDVRCSCGYDSHIDGRFLYFIQCPVCEKVYMTNGHIELVELSPSEVVEVEDRVVIADE